MKATNLQKKKPPSDKYFNWNFTKTCPYQVRVKELEEKKTPTWAAINCFSPSTVMPLLRTPRTVGNLGSSLVDKDVSSVSRAKFYLLLRLIKNFTNTATHERPSFSVFRLCELRARWEDLTEKTELLSIQNVWCRFSSTSPQGWKPSLGEVALLLYLFNLKSLKNWQGKSYVPTTLLPFQWHLNNGTETTGLVSFLLKRNQKEMSDNDNGISQWHKW